MTKFCNIHRFKRTNGSSDVRSVRWKAYRKRSKDCKVIRKKGVEHSVVRNKLRVRTRYEEVKCVIGFVSGNGDVLLETKQVERGKKG